MSAARRLAQLFVVVAIMSAAMGLYFLAASSPRIPPVTTRTSLDDLVPVWPASVFVYLSPYLLAPLLSSMLPARIFSGLLLRAALLLPVQLGAYFVVPTTVTRPPPPTGDAPSEALLRLVYAVDTPPANAAPSGHVSLAFIIAWAMWAALPRARPLTLIYFVAVCLSILFTGQHHVVDLLTGALLGTAALAAARAWERRR